MTVEQLKTMTKAEIKAFIKKSLEFEHGVLQSIDGDIDPMRVSHKRFDMSFGYAAMPWNTGILNTFAYLGIYEPVNYLFLEFWKGNVTLHIKFKECEGAEFDFSCDSTSEIIFQIIALTVLAF